MNVSKWEVFVLVALIALPVGRAAAPVAGPLVTVRARGTTASTNGYLEILPAGYGAGPLPLLIAFHGRGENGPGDARSLEALKITGVVPNWTSDRAAILLAPQHAEGCPNADVVSRFIEFAKTKYQVDPRRIYLTGLSCGARGVADYLAHFGGAGIAAAVLIAGDISPAWSARGCLLARELPLWVMHGELDDVVPDIGDRTSMAHFAACAGHRPVRYDGYRGVGHDAWTQGYAVSANHDVFGWMFGFSR